MTSKISFSNAVKNNLKNRGWLVALSWLGSLLSLPVYISLWLYNMQNPDGRLPVWIGQQFSEMLCSQGNLIFGAFILGLAILSAVTGYSYLHDPVQVDLYHSLPVTRREGFLINYVSGLLIFLPPYLVGAISGMITGAAHHLMTGSVFAACLLSMVSALLSFLVLYHITILGMMLTGKIFPGILAAGVLALYGSILETVLRSLADTFFQTYWYNSLDDSLLLDFISPVRWFLYTLYPGDRGGSILKLILTIAALVIVWLVSLKLCEIRRSEAAGNALAFPKSASAIKYLIAVPTSICLGIFIGSMVYSAPKSWIIMWSLFSAVLLCAVIEFIYHPDLKCLLDRKVASIAAVLTVAAILAVFRYDLIGYDTRLPKESDVVSIGFVNYDLEDYLNYNLLNLSHVDEYVNMLTDEQFQYTDFAPLYMLSELGAAHTQDTQFDSDTACQIRVMMTLKNGKRFYRCYDLTREEVVSTLETLWAEEETRVSKFPIHLLNTDQITGISFSNLIESEKLLDIPTQEILDAYMQDLAQIPIRTLDEEAPVARLSLTITRAYEPDDMYSNAARMYDGQYFGGNLYIFKDYAHTIRCLKKYGITADAPLDPANISRMTVSNALYEKTKYGVTEYVSEDTREITDPAEQARILDRIIFDTRALLGDHLFDEHVEITFSNVPAVHTYALKQE